MFLTLIGPKWALLCILRACGDVSNDIDNKHNIQLYSPRMRRCFPEERQNLLQASVFSAHAEMFPKKYQYEKEEGSILRACGDVSS